MCGISAFFKFKPSSTPSSDEAALDESLTVVKHRGPDARGKWMSEDGRVGLGHVRLAIVDLSAEANQPFHDHAADIHVVVNGEFYGYERYKKELAHEFDFKSKSDSEILIALYKHYGLGLLSHLRGEFAFILWDARRQFLFSARDRYGIKSLYYTVVNDRLLVATEMKSFLAFGWTPEWSVRNLKSNSWQHRSETFFRGVHTLLPGHYLTSEGFQDVEVRQYWDLDYPDRNIVETRTEEEMISEVRERLLEAVKVRLGADVPVGIYLSGGIDSSAIAGMVTHLVKNSTADLGNDKSHEVSKIKCFTVSFEKDTGEDESEIARRTADWLGVEFHRVLMDEQALADRLEDTVWHSESLFPFLNASGKLALAELTRSHGITVVLTGEGSDEHFAGYKIMFAPGGILCDDHSWPSAATPPVAKQSQINGASKCQESSSTRRMLNHTSATKFILGKNSVPFAQWTNEAYGSCDAESNLAESFDGRVRDAMANKWHLLHTSEYLCIKAFLPHYILRYNGDNIDMVHQIESRPPFLDHQVTEYVNHIPPSLKMKYDPEADHHREKHILREATRPFITDEVYNQEKKPYLGPKQFPVGGPLYQKLEGLVTRENVEQLGFLDWDQVHAAFTGAFGGNTCGNCKAVVSAGQGRFCGLHQVAMSEDMSTVVSVAQLVVLSQRFGAARAVNAV